MQIRVSLSVSEDAKVEGVIEIEDRKLEEMPEEEVEGIIEVYVRNWANDRIRIEWEEVTNEE